MYKEVQTRQYKTLGGNPVQGMYVILLFYKLEVNEPSLSIWILPILSLVYFNLKKISEEKYKKFIKIK